MAVRVHLDCHFFTLSLTLQVLALAQSGTPLPLAPRFPPSYTKKASLATRPALGFGALTSPQRNLFGKTGLLA